MSPETNAIPPAALDAVAVCLIRDHLNDLPDFAPPPGWSLRWYQPGDETHWHRIHLAAETHRVITRGLFQEQFGRDPSPLAARQCYLCDPMGVAVGTGTAWWDDDFAGERWGRVHWLAIIPDYQGRGLGRVLLSAVGRRLRELGHDRAFLRTLASRRPALNLYLKFGFQPWPRNPQEKRTWQTVAPGLKYPCPLP